MHSFLAHLSVSFLYLQLVDRLVLLCSFCLFTHSFFCVMLRISSTAWRCAYTYTQRAHLLSCKTFSTKSSDFLSQFQISPRIGNIQDPSKPFVLIETGFLSRCLLFSISHQIVKEPESGIYVLNSIENTIRDMGCIPLSLGMLNGKVGW